MNNQISYKCPSCAAQLTYSPNGRLMCEACGNEYDVDIMNKIAQSSENVAEFDWAGYKKNLEENVEGFECCIYVCNSCGAQIDTGDTDVTAHCPYCGSEIVFLNKISGELKPNVIIPFKIAKETAINAVKDHFAGKSLLPKSFLKEYALEKIQNVYVPFWLFDAHTKGTVFFNTQISDSYTSGNYDCTDTKHYLVEVEGEVGFSKIPVDASFKIDNDLMDALEPFDYNELEEFTTAYLSGFLADRFDEGPDDCLGRATERFKNSVSSLFEEDTCRGYDSSSVKSCDLRLIDPTVKYALLPVYLLNLKYRNKNYRFAVNGQTGKVVGELPIDLLKRIKCFLWGYIKSNIITAIIVYIVAVLVFGLG